MSDDGGHWPPPARPAAVHRPYDTAGALLYVGMSTNPEQRMVGRRDSSPWWGDVARPPVVTWFRTEADALSAEARAIATENPVHNAQPGQTIPRLGGPDTIFTEEAARHVRLIWSIRDMYTLGGSVESMSLLFGQAAIDQALGDAS